MLTSPEVHKTLDTVKFKRPQPLTFVAPTAFGLRIVTRPLEAAPQTQGKGLKLMQETVEAMERFNQVGIIESIGPQAKELYPQLNKNDYIVLPRYMGDEIYVKGTRFLSIFAEAIVMTLDNPEEIINFIAEEDTTDGSIQHKD